MSFGIYIHWPFCRSKCPYCDFPSRPAKTVDLNVWEKAYEDALTGYAARLPDKTVESVFFGGGTPSMTDPALIEKLISTIKKSFKVSDDVEISLEANPDSANEEKMLSWRKAGVNRLSVGVQSLIDRDLKFLGRLHSAEDALKTIKAAKAVFPVVSADFIYARPDQTLAAWKNELRQILDLNLLHYSFYQLTIEEGTFFHKKGVEPPEEGLCADMFDLTDRETRLAGVPRYEVSNHADKAHRCRHNQLYWQGGEWIGVGTGAHGRFTENGRFVATAESPLPDDFINRRGHEEYVLTQKEKAEELILTALRTEDGLNRDVFRALVGSDFENFLDAGVLQDYQTDGFLVCDKKGLRTTAKGLLILNALFPSLLV